MQQTGGREILFMTRLLVTFESHTQTAQRLVVGWLSTLAHTQKLNYVSCIIFPVHGPASVESTCLPFER